ncbi:hypothetical protein KAR91_48750 [Candidatus Pacearchaeota archaeon]|nr:hypothetical protein [Candidatus Pacearchaeota archaeon]
MAIETQEREIDGHKYTVTSFGGIEGTKIKSVLLKHLGPAAFSFGVVGSVSEKGFLETNIDPMMVAQLFEGLFSKLDENQYVTFILRLLSNTRRDNIELSKDVYNAEFAGEYRSLYKVLFFVLEVNYKKSFFVEGGIGELVKKIKALIPQDKNFGNDSIQK